LKKGKWRYRKIAGQKKKKKEKSEASPYSAEGKNGAQGLLSLIGTLRNESEKAEHKKGIRRQKRKATHNQGEIGKRSLPSGGEKFQFAEKGRRRRGGAPTKKNGKRQLARG